MSSNEQQAWHFFTNHLEVLLYVARHPDDTLRTIADKIGITERAAHRILRQLAGEGYVEIHKTGRRNYYRLLPGTTLRHRANRAVPVQALVDLVTPLAQDHHSNPPATEADLRPGRPRGRARARTVHP
jgi:DNA-binding IclR family transcriptional regulator